MLGAMVYSALADNGNVAALVGTRIYPMILPQNPTYPAITYQRISGTPQNGSTALREIRYQINGWAATYAGAESLATAIKGAMENYTRASGGVDIKIGRVVNDLDDYDEETGNYRRIIDVVFDTTGD